MRRDGALHGIADALGRLHALAVGAQRAPHRGVVGVAELGRDDPALPEPVLRLVRDVAPHVVVRYARDDRQRMPHRGVDLHGHQAKSAVAEHADHRRAVGERGGVREGEPDAERAEGC